MAPGTVSLAPGMGSLSLAPAIRASDQGAPGTTDGRARDSTCMSAGNNMDREPGIV